MDTPPQCMKCRYRTQRGAEGACRKRAISRCVTVDGMVRIEKWGPPCGLVNEDNACQYYRRSWVSMFLFWR